MAYCVLFFQTAHASCDKNFTHLYYEVELSEVPATSVFFNQMRDKYFGETTNISGIVGNRTRSIVYYDSDTLDLLNNNSELYYVVDEQIPNYRTSRETIIYRRSLTTRGKQQVFEAKKYNRKSVPLDKHPLFGRVKRRERADLITSLSEFNENPAEQIKAVLEVKHEEVVYLFTRFGTTYGEIVLDKFHISSYGVPNTFTSLRFELFADKIYQLTDDEQHTITNMFCNTMLGFQNQFPSMRGVAQFNYADYFKLAIELLPTRMFFHRYPVVFQLGQIIILTVISFLVLYLLVGRYSRKQFYSLRTKYEC